MRQRWLGGIGLVLVFALGAAGVAGALTQGVIWRGCAGTRCTGQTDVDSALCFIVAGRYDWGITTLPSDTTGNWDKAYISTVDTAFKWLAPWTIADIYGPPQTGDTVAVYDTLAARAGRLSWRLEDHFLHFVDSTVVVTAASPAETLHIRPWGHDSTGSRVPVHTKDFSGGLGRFAIAAATAHAKQLWKEMIVEKTVADSFYAVTPALYPQGVFFDEAAGNITSGTVLLGGHVKEDADTLLVVGTAAFTRWYFSNHLSPLMEAVSDSLATGAAWHPDSLVKYTAANIGGQWPDSLIAQAPVDIVFTDGRWGTVDSVGVGNAWVRTLVARDSLAEAAGMVTWYAPPPTRRHGAGSTTYSYGQQLLNNYALHALVRRTGSIFFENGATTVPAKFDTLCWRDGLTMAELYLGTPTGRPFKIAASTDPTGHQFDVWARGYSGGLVLVRNWGALTEKVGEATVVTVQLPLYYRRLDAEGWAEEGSQRWAKIRNGEGVILIGPVSNPNP